MPRVFVVNEPTIRTPGGSIERKMDFSSAMRWGDLVYLSDARNLPGDLSPIVNDMSDALRDYSDEDWLIPVGHPLLIGIATAVAAAFNNGRVNLLHWKRDARAYQPATAILPHSNRAVMPLVEAIDFACSTEGSIHWLRQWRDGAQSRRT